VNSANRAKAVGLVLAMLAACLSLWTLNPLLWLWVASQIDAGGPPSMTAISVVVLGVIITCVAIAKLLAVLHRNYREIRGIRTTVKVRMPWSGSGRDERGPRRPRELELTVLDVILIGSVFLAAGLYEYWYIFESSSPIDQRSGRG
jgi:hypothetical protein